MNEILKLLESIKEKIELVEASDESKELLNEIRSQFILFIEKAQLILIAHKEVYYGYFLLNMETRVNFYEDVIAAVSFENNPVKFISNPLLLCKMSLPEILFVICHEIDHILYNHPSDFAKYVTSPNKEKHYKFNLAADAAINDVLIHEIEKRRLNFLKAPKGVVTSNTIKEIVKNNNCDAIVTYRENWLSYYSAIKDINLFPQIELLVSGGDYYENENKGGKKVVTEKNRGNITSHIWTKNAQLPETQEKLKEFVNNVNASIPENNRGEMSTQLEELINIINKPAVLPWNVILKKLIGTVNCGKRKTRLRLNRRQPTRYDLSGEMSEKTLKLVVAIDTSGSMTNDLISDVFNEIFEIIKKRKFELTIIECDAEIKKVYKVKKRADVQLIVEGRGGTAFTPVIEYVNNNPYFRDAVLIYFTDGVAETEIPKPLIYKTIWVTNEKKEAFSVTEPYGVVIEM